MDIFIRNKPYTGPLRAAVLDWAGTTVDHGCFGPVAAFLEIFRKWGVEVTPAEARAPMGLMKIDHIRAMIEMESVALLWEEVHGRRPDERDVRAMYPEIEAHLASTLADHAEPVPGCLEAVTAMRGLGLKIGTSTGYTRPMVEIVAGESARRGYAPDTVVCSSDVPAGRPFPYMCYLNAVKLQTYPLEAMVKIGDTVSDIREGLNAGMWTIAVTKTSNELGLSESEVEALPDEELTSRLRAIETRFLNAGANFVVEGIWRCPEIVEKINQISSRGETPLTCSEN